MPEQVDECPYCRGTFPHQGPTGCPPIKWPPDPKPAELGDEKIDRLNRFGEYA